MNPYILKYETEESCESTTLDGSSDVKYYWINAEKILEAESDVEAEKGARAILSKLIQYKKTIRNPILCRVINIPRMDGIIYEHPLQAIWNLLYTKID